MVDSLQWFLPSCDWSNLKFALPCLEFATAPHCGLERPSTRSHLCKPMTCFPSQMCIIRTQVHCTVPIKISNYPLSIFCLDPPLPYVHMSLCLHMSPYVSICLHMSPYVPMSPYVSICLHMSPYVSICLHMSPYVSICTCLHMHICTYAHMHMSPYAQHICRYAHWHIGR